MESVKYDIKETEEMIRGLGMIAGTLIDSFKGGFSYLKLFRVFSKMAFSSELKKAISGVKNITNELKDLDSDEMLKIGQVLIEEISKHLKSKEA